MRDPRLTPLVAGLPADVPFVPPEAIERRLGRPFDARLGANESGFGPSPRAAEAMAQVAPDAWMYPDGEAHDLVADLSRLHDVPPEAIMVGTGIDGLLRDTVRLFVGPGDGVVTSAGAYPTFVYHATSHGADLTRVPYDGLHEDPAALIAAAEDNRAKLVYLSNPDNPMGSWHPPEAISEMIEAVPGHALMVLDEAYEECSDTPTAPPLDTGDRRVLRFRTFSKAHGLAGMRIAYAIGPPDIIAAFSLVRDHFGVSRLAQAAARASLADRDHLPRVRAAIAQSAERIARIGRDNGLIPRPTTANFVALDTGAPETSSRLVGSLVDHGIFVRRPTAAPLDGHIRVSCGPPLAMDRLEAALPLALSSV